MTSLSRKDFSEVRLHLKTYLICSKVAFPLSWCWVSWPHEHPHTSTENPSTASQQSLHSPDSLGQSSHLQLGELCQLETDISEVTFDFV